MLGDSITEGWDGFENVEQNEAYWVERDTGFPVTNHGHGGGAIVGDQSKDLTQAVSNTDFSQYDLVTIGYGVNDFNGSNSSLQNLIQVLDNNIERICASNSNIILVGILPILGNTNAINAGISAAGYSWNDFQNALLNEFKQRNGYAIDWRINPIVTKNNFSETLNDNWLHPNLATYELLGKRISDEIMVIDSSYIESIPYSAYEIKYVFNKNVQKINVLTDHYDDETKDFVGKSVLKTQLSTINSNYFDRQFRHEMLQSISELGILLNELDELFFLLGITDKNGNLYKSSKIDFPDSLIINDDFIGIINADFNVYSKSINKLVDFIK